MKKQLSVIPKIILIDIGGFTVDYMVLRFGQLEMEYVDSLENVSFGYITVLKRR